jgi:site-specific DNA recombinase
MAVRALTETAPTALIYVRVSTKGQEDDGTSLDTQERACREHAASLGYAVAQVFREVYSGAELFDRPQLNALRAEARTKQHDTVIVYALDRLTRAQGLTAYLLSEFERSGTELLSVTDPLDASKEGKLIVGIKEYVAEVEREKIRERSLRGKRARVEAGKLHRYGTELYGYRRDHELGVRTIYEPEAAIVREIFHAVADEGLSARAVWRRLNERGVPPPSAGKRKYQADEWSNTTIRRIIRDATYKGDTIVWRWQQVSSTGAMKPRPESETVALPEGVTPALVSPAIWQTAGERLATNLSTRTRNEKRPYLLRGRIRCADCGRAMSPGVDRGNRNYRCTSHGEAGIVCHATRVRADDSVPRSALPRDDHGRMRQMDTETRARLASVPGVESWVWDQISNILRDPSIIAAELDRMAQDGPQESLSEELESATSRLQAIDKQQKRLMQRYAEADDDAFPWELVQEQVTRLEREKQTVSGIITDIEGRVQAEQAAAQQLHELQVYVERVASNLKAFDFDEKRLALDALGVTVYADGRD